MSTTEDEQSDVGTPADETPRSQTPPRMTRFQLGVIGLSLVAAAVILAVGLPEMPRVFGALPDATIPAALFVAFTGIVAVNAVSVHRTWPVVDIVIASLVGVVGGFYLWIVAAAWEPMTAPLSFYPPASALLAGLWLVPGVLGGLIIRRPGAAVYTELVAATLEAVLGNQWGMSTIWYGLLQGLGAEVVFAVLLYRAWGLLGAAAAAVGAGLTVGSLDTFLYYTAFSVNYKITYIMLAVLSGVVIAGVGSWALTRALASTGALSDVASGRAAERV
jgi:energy-coupling factor transport system substrate-specific component